MPTYDHHCAACGNEFEAFTHMNDNTVVCPKCHGIAWRLFSPPRSKPICDIEPYLDENISKDGAPVYVQSRRHKAHLLRENGLIMKDSISSYR